ncbi:MAG: hypothetical protein OHK0057_13310 [Thermoflexibacter sp.]
MQKLVTVVITVYNGEKYLTEAIESVLSQTYRAIELILVNDGSRDRSLEIIQDYASKDDRIVVIDHPNRGISASNNAAIAIAKGFYYAKIDADDTMHPQRIEKQVAYLENNPEVTMVSCQAYYINGKGKIIGEQITPGYTKIEDSHIARQTGELVIALHSGFITYMEKMREIGGYREDLKCMVDLDLYTRLVQKGGVMIIMPDKFINYRMHLSSVMAVTSKDNLMQVTRSWLRDSYRKQAQGMIPLSFEEYKEVQKKEKFWTRLMRKFANLSYHYRRNAIIYYGDRAYLPFIYSLTMATLLQPTHIFKRLVVWGRRKIKH